MRKILFSIAILLLSVSFSYSQNGGVKGQVKDFITQETIIGAAVTVSANKGVATDLDGNFILKLDDGAQAWCVYDRDKEPNDGKDTAFNDSIVTANSKGIKTAWSNDNFELWILLHFEDVDIQNHEYLSRKKYYERLTEILKQSFPHEAKFQNQRYCLEE
jgi:hypothetical protein